MHEWLAGFLWKKEEFPAMISPSGGTAAIEISKG
jgi:hypothetical protein